MLFEAVQTEMRGLSKRRRPLPLAPRVLLAVIPGRKTCSRPLPFAQAAGALCHFLRYEGGGGVSYWKMHRSATYHIYPSDTSVTNHSLAGVRGSRLCRPIDWAVLMGEIAQSQKSIVD